MNEIVHTHMDGLSVRGARPSATGTGGDGPAPVVSHGATTAAQSRVLVRTMSTGTIHRADCVRVLATKFVVWRYAEGRSLADLAIDVVNADLPWCRVCWPFGET